MIEKKQPTSTEPHTENLNILDNENICIWAISVQWMYASCIPYVPYVLKMMQNTQDTA